jgi:hypothetical protein
MTLALGKLTTGTPKFRGSGFVGMHVKPITAQEKFNFPRANAILTRAQALLWVRDWRSRDYNFKICRSARGSAPSAIQPLQYYQAPYAPG